MGRGPSAKGLEARRRILAELGRRYSEFETPPTWIELSQAVGMGYGTMQFHVAKLRQDGLIHPSALWITRAGFMDIGGHTH